MSEKSYHHGNLRNALVEKGIELINQKGIDQLSLRKVSALCGVSQTALYSHFQNKEDLLEAMQDYVIQQFMEVLDHAINSCSNPNDPDVLIQLGKSYVLFFIHRPHYFRFLFSHTNIEMRLSLNSNETNSFPPLELFKTIVIRIFNDAEMSEDELEDTMISLWATVHGLAAIATMKNVHYEKDWEKKIESIIRNK